MLNRLKKSNSKGFTIIEVMIVLAIAGLILLIVFLAVPALQRSSRNTQRKNDSSHLGGLISEWESNNAGTTPTGFGTGGGSMIDISTEKFSIITTPTTVTAAPSTGDIPAPSDDTPFVYTNAVCSGNTATYTASTRAIVVYYWLETASGAGSTACISAS